MDPRTVRRRRHLDEATQIHDPDPVAEKTDQCQIVGNEDEGQTQLPPQLVQKLNDLGLDGDVERRGGLVEHQEPRL